MTLRSRALAHCLRVLGGLFLGCALARPASARVDIEIDYVDGAGVGFFDETPREPLSDNPGTTLGEQRRLAFERALQIWGAALESDVPIVVEATFEPFPELLCEGNSAILGAARAEAAFAGFPGAPRPDLFYPSPLADKLAGEDLDPGSPDISALFNPRLDDADCLRELGWDYGFAATQAEASFVSSVLHELAHGLGFASLVDETTGSAGEGLSIFESFMFDRQSGLTWDVMSDEQRRVSAASPLDLLWLGERVTQAAPDVLAVGAPRIELSNGDALTLVSEPSFEPFLDERIEGELLFVDAAEACQGSLDLAGRVVMLAVDAGCPDLAQQLRRVGQRGAVAALTRSLVSGEPPFGIVADLPRMPMVSLALSQADFDALLAELEGGELSATLRVDRALLGADADGRVRLSATNPVQPGSSASHWDTSVRRRRDAPDDPVALLMEPVTGGFLDNRVSDLSVQLLQDLGWGGPVCGDGVVEGAEECDRGIDNSDDRADGCRRDCSDAHCGDGVVDTGEDCEPRLETACGSDCRPSPEPTPLPPAPTPDAGRMLPNEPEPREPSDGAVATPSYVDAGGAPLGPIAPESCGCRLRGGGVGAPFTYAALTAWLLLRRRRAHERRSPYDRS